MFSKEETKKVIQAARDICGAGCEITAFGDGYADTGMLELCGKGIAMGNAADEVKEKADLVIGSNDEDGIAVYLEGQNW